MEERIEALEQDVVTVKQELRFQRRMLQALSETQSEHTRDLRMLKEGVQELRQDVSELRRDVSELRQGNSTIVGMLTTLIEREERGG